MRAELKALRDFLWRITGHALVDGNVGSWNLGEATCAKLEGLRVGARGRVVLCARVVSERSVEIGYALVPEGVQVHR